MPITLTQVLLIPTNVVEVGNEVSQSVLNGLAASSISGTNPAATVSAIWGRPTKPNLVGTSTLFDYGSFTTSYPSEVLITTPIGSYYIPVR